MFAGDTLLYSDTYYRVGEGHKDFDQDKTNDEDYYLLTLAAIAKELSLEGLQEAKVHLAAGLPMNWVGRQRDGFKAYLLKNQEVQFQFNDVAYHVTFVGASFYPQGYPAVLTKDPKKDLKGDAVLADIGNGTINILYLRDGQPNGKLAWTEKLGAEQCAIAIRGAVMDQFGVVIPDGAVEQILRTGKADIGKEYLEAARYAASQYVATIFSALRRHEYDPSLMKLIMVGGGSCLIRNFGKTTGKVILVDDICATAKGYEMLAAQRLGKGVEDNLVLYLVSLIPIVTGLDVEGVIGNVMIPTMIMNTYINFYCLKVPDLYPEQWKKRGVRYPRWLWNAFSIIGGAFAIVVIYNTFINMDTKAMTICVIELAVMFGMSFLTLKKGWVSQEQLAANKQAAINEALATE